MKAHTRDLAREGLRAYLAQPESPGPGGVLVLPGHYGLDERARSFADQLAEAGLTAIVNDQYSHQPRTPTKDEAATWAKELRDQTSLDQMATWLTYMQSELSVSALGTIGFCQGGRFALLLAAHDRRLAACVTFYPSLNVPNRPNQEMDAVALAGEIRCPTMLVHAGLDHVTKPETFLALRDNLLARPAPTDVQVYPDGDHGFMTAEEHLGPGNDAARQLSWPQAVAFLLAALG